MEYNLPLIRALATTLLSEIDTVGNGNQTFSQDEPFSLNEKVREFEVKLIRAALLKTGGNQRRAASLLGLKVTTLNNKIKSYDIKYLKGVYY